MIFSNFVFFIYFKHINSFNNTRSFDQSFRILVVFIEIVKLLLNLYLNALDWTKNNGSCTNLIKLLKTIRQNFLEDLNYF